MPFPGSHSQVFYWGATGAAYLLRSRFILQHLHFPKFQANTPASASFYSMPMAAAAAASSSKPKRNYDVFLSFRGTDVRNNFLGHLYTALDQHGFFTYIDSEELRKGEQISPALMNAIEESHVAIIIFSEDYASSPWCLEEVAKIMECKEQRDLMVFPVFYKVDPCEVRTPRKSYKEAMAKQEIKFGKDSEKVKRWKKALLDAGNLSGWPFTDGDEAKLIKRIVEGISLQLDRTPLHVSKHPVGIHLRVEKLKSMLDLQSDDDVLMIGLWGQGGIGKTTLAKALYNDIFRQFEGSCFLANVQEASRDSKDLVSVQKKLLSDILVGKQLAMTSVDEGINLMQRRLCRKKVLLVLDDANDLKQLDALAGDCEWFGEGSRIIITTRDSHLLTSHGIEEDHIYKVQTLDNCEALQLFNKHAFVRNNKIVIQRDLVDSALRYADGLPLALEVLGSFLRGRREHEWESALSKLDKSPNEKINKVLKLSYDGLEQNEKEIFLDIACFFKGRYIKDIMKVLDGCGFDTIIGVQVLVEKSLIFEDRHTLCMHDLIRMMGMDIVKQECLDDPGKRSRLWLYDDVHYVLSGDMGTNAVKAIVLDLHKPKEICIGPDAFTNMKRLRLLIMINVHTSFQGPIGLPNELRWFEWPGCPWVPQFSSGPKKLVGFDLQRSNIQVVRDQFKGLVNLKFLNLQQCQSLVRMPDLSCVPNLEELNLGWCKNLEHAHESVAYHSKLRQLDLSGCSKLRRFPEIPDKNKSLRKLYLNETSIEELPASIGNLISLEDMTLSRCKKLAILPSSIYKLQNLTHLRLKDCSKLIKFPKVEDLSDPRTKTGFLKLGLLELSGCNLSEAEFLENFSCFPHLGCLLLSGNNFANLPTCEKLYNLKWLHVYNCQQLQEIPNIPGKMSSVDATNCESLSRIPSNICDVENVVFGSCHELVRNGYSMNDWFKPKKFHHPVFQIVLPGGQMPKWLLPNKEGYISFVASKDLYKRFLGVAWCAVLHAKEDGLIGFSVEGVVNGKRQAFDEECFQLSNSDNVCLQQWKPFMLWQEVDFGPNDLSHFQLCICVGDPRSRVTVKNCGFRLLCKPLENDLEALLQDDQLLDPALLYKVGYEDSQTSSDEEISSETEDLQDSQMSTKEDNSSELVHKGLNIADFSIEKYRYSKISPELRNIRPRGEMPEEFVPVEDGTISFRASHDLYDKFIGLALCVVFGVEDGKKEISFDIVPCVHGRRRNVLSGTLGSFDSDHMWIQYFKPNALWGVLGGAVDFDQFKESYLQFTLIVRVLGGTMKKLGYMLRCGQLEDDLKVVLKENQLVDPALVYEDSDSDEDISIEYLNKFHIFQGTGSSDSETD